MTTELPPDFHHHAEALENFRLALIAATEKETPIDYATCLGAWGAVVFGYAEWMQIEAAAAGQIEQLETELFFHNTNVVATA